MHCGQPQLEHALQRKEHMKLQMSKRSAAKKSEIKSLRREGNIPAVLYHRGKPSETIAINGAEYNAALRKITPGHLSTIIFELAAGSTIRRALIKDIQYDPTTYNVIHLDFEELIDNVPVKVKVPIEITGLVDCVGIKLGGVLRQVIRSLRVFCLPKDLPKLLQIDIKAMNVGDVKRLSDLDIPQTVKPLADINEVAIVIAKR